MMQNLQFLEMLWRFCACMFLCVKIHILIWWAAIDFSLLCIFLDSRLGKKTQPLGQCRLWSVWHKSLTCSHLENDVCLLSSTQRDPTRFKKDKEMPIAVSQFLEWFPYEKRLSRMSLEKRSDGCIIPVGRTLNCMKNRKWLFSISYSNSA